MFSKRKLYQNPRNLAQAALITMVLPRANNGMQSVCSIVCNFNGIVMPGPGREPKKNLHKAIKANKNSNLIGFFINISI